MKPNLLIAGAQKSGTTWLHKLLAQHPDIAMSERKELNYFQRPESVYRANWDRYLDNWAGATERWRGESTPHYFWCCQPPFGPRGMPDAALRIKERLGDDLTALVLLRDPVSRAVSGYWHNFAMKRFDPATVGIFRLPPQMGVIDLGFYRRHHEHWATVLGPDRIHTMLYDDLVANPKGWIVQALDAIGASVDVPDFWASIDPEQRIHDRVWVKKYRKQRPSVTAAEIAALLELYRDDIAYVEDLTGRALPAWRDLDALIARHCASEAAGRPGGWMPPTPWPGRKPVLVGATPEPAPDPEPE